jgi:AcrR family transcriptional regulator
MSALDTADRILDAAAELIAERGYAAMTTRLIAERAGVNEVTIFRRFENKVGVLKALAARFAQESAEIGVEDTSEGTGARSVLLAMARTEIASAQRNGGVALRLAFDARSVPEIAELLGEGPRANIEKLAAYMAELQRAGELRSDVNPLALAEAFGSMTSSYVMYRTVMGVVDDPEGLTTEQAIEQLFDIFWSGASNKEGV